MKSKPSEPGKSMINAPETSHIRAYGYDDDKGEMTVVWRNGKSHIYEGVSKETWEGMVNAQSKGGYIHSHVKGAGHRCRAC